MYKKIFLIGAFILTIFLFVSCSNHVNNPVNSGKNVETLQENNAERKILKDDISIQKATETVNLDKQEKTSENEVVTDIINWNHPTEKVFKDWHYTLTKVKLISNKTYPVLYIKKDPAAEDSLQI